MKSFEVHHIVTSQEKKNQEGHFMFHRAAVDSASQTISPK